MPKRIQMSRQHPWRADNPDAVIVARPSRWGNPFVIGERTIAGVTEPSGVRRFATAVHDRNVAVMLHRLWIESESANFKVQIIEALRDHDLACWCPIDQPCHADVLLELANGGAS